MNKIEEEALKLKKKKKIFTVVLSVIGILLLVWTVFTIVQNLNKSERMVYNSLIKATQDLKYPAETELLDCGEIIDATTNEGKSFKFCIVKLNRTEDNKQKQTGYYYLVVSGKGEGDIYTKENIETLESESKNGIEFNISKKNESINIKKMNSTLKKYWNFKDVD